MNAKEISGTDPDRAPLTEVPACCERRQSRAADQTGRMLRASAIARPTIGGTMSERASLFAKSDDDVGPPRAMREQQAQKNCREVTIRTSEDSSRTDTSF